MSQLPPSGTDPIQNLGSSSEDDPDRPVWDASTRIEAEYDYQDERGRTLFTVIKGRRADNRKTFVLGHQPEGSLDLIDRDRRDNPHEFYGWEPLKFYRKGKGNAPHVPYRLPELLADMAARPDDPVFLTEGEKDTESLRALGLIATTAANGAKHFPSEIARYFTRRNVVALLDNDPNGRARAGIVRAALSRYATVKAVMLPNLPENGDVTDYLEAGHTRDDLLAAVREAEDYGAGSNAGDGADCAPGPQAATEAAGLALIDAGTLAGKAVEPMEFAIAKLAPANLVTLFTARGGGGKSYISLSMAASVALGARAYGFATTQAPAIYATAEDNDAENHRRLIGVANAHGVGLEAFGRKLYLVSLVDRRDKGLVRIDLNTNKMVVLPLFHELRASILQVGARFVVLDNVAHLFEGNENIRAHVAAFLGLLNALALETACAIILISHPNKNGDSYSGSTAFQNQVRSHIHLETDSNDPDARELTLAKANYARLEEPLRLRWHRGAFRLDAMVPEEDREASGRAQLEDQRFLACLDARNEAERPVSMHTQARATYAPLAFAKMPQAKGMTKDQFEEAMERLLAAGVIGQVGLPYDKPNSPGHKAEGLAKIGTVEVSDEPF
ncbi:AAA family ATPase [Stakelama sp. CBK3Z-3]|uniref:AAA family ATPase n=1 Tax=Stakelama flava TaxID=2860338 RepID=A0ABS6XKY2_9SPHN|nr:AAA family ATPase [Stakelama flava]MBW4330046.1 AAA family ATPase [Stakelama flava]